MSTGGRNPGAGAETPDTFAARLAGVRARIAEAATRAGRDPDDVLLVAATKTVPAARLSAALAAGLVDLGENRAQELLSKALELAGETVAPRWHFLGNLQRNKVKALAPWIACWQSVDRPELGPVLARHAPGARVLVEVNLAVGAAEGWLRPERHERSRGRAAGPRVSTSPA